MEKFREEIDWSGQKYLMEWNDCVDFESLLNPKNVFGFVFDGSGKLCMVKFRNKDHWGLPGGGIEENETPEECLCREVMEEADLEICEIKRLGYFNVKPLSDNCERGEHQLLRFVARVKEVKEQTHDPAEGYIPERDFVEPNVFLDRSVWGEGGKMQLGLALGVLG